MKNNPNWLDIGDQSKKVREELFNLHRLTTGNMPVAIVRHITKAIADLDSFRSFAEERMMKVGASDDTGVFYGPNRKKQFIEWIGQFGDGETDDYDLYHIATFVERNDTFPTSNDFLDIHDYAKKNGTHFTFEAFLNAWDDYGEYKHGKHFSTVETIPDEPFTSWIKFYGGSDGVFGDLADDILKDPNFPTSNDIAEMQCYLKNSTAISRTMRHRVVRALNHAWYIYTGGYPTP